MSPKRLLLAALALLSLVHLSLLNTGCATQPSFDEQALYSSQLQHRKIKLAQVALTPSSYWQHETRRQHSQRDVDELLMRYQALFAKTFARQMASAGWAVTDDAPLTATLEVSELRINAPDIQGTLVDLYAQDELGSAIFSLSIYEGDKLVARFVDRRDVNTIVPGKLEPTNRVINQQGFKRELKHFLEDTQQALKPAFRWL